MNSTPQIGGIGSNGTLPLKQADTSPVSVAKSDFSKMLNTTVEQVVKAEQRGETAIEKLNSGEAQNLHDVMIAVEQADLSVRMLTQLRNKALEAYNEIIKMNI